MHKIQQAALKFDNNVEKNRIIERHLTETHLRGTNSIWIWSSIQEVDIKFFRNISESRYLVGSRSRGEQMTLWRTKVILKNKETVPLNKSALNLLMRERNK